VVAELVVVEVLLEVVDDWLDEDKSWLLVVDTCVLDDLIEEVAVVVEDDVVLIREALYMYNESRFPAPQYSVLLPVHNI
jgi:hypothetical protein